MEIITQVKMKKVLLFGSSSFIGKKIIESMINKRKVLLSGTYNKNYKKIKKYKNRFNFYKLNFLRTQDSLKKSIYIIKKFEPDCLIFCSSLRPNRKKIENISYNELKNIFTINFFFYYLLLSNIKKKINKKFLIINFLSYSIISGGNKISAYSASKASMEILSKSIANETKNFHFRNLIFPSISKSKSNTCKKKISYIKVISKINEILKKNNSNTLNKTYVIKS